MVEDLAGQALDRLLADAPPAARIKTSEVLDLLRATFRSGFAFGLGPARPGGIRSAVVLRGGAKNGTRGPDRADDEGGRQHDAD